MELRPPIQPFAAETNTSPEREGMRKLGKLYSQLVELGIRTTDDVVDFITGAAIDLSIADEDTITTELNRSQTRITEWQVSTALYAAIELHIEQEKNKRKKEAPDHKKNAGESTKKAEAIHNLRRAIIRLIHAQAFTSREDLWVRYHRTILALHQGQASPDQQIQALESLLAKMQKLPV